MSRVRHVIHCIEDQYARARGNYDVEYAQCKMTSGRVKTFEADDPEFEAFVDDHFKYWAAHGWTYLEEAGRKILRWTGKKH